MEKGKRPEDKNEFKNPGILLTVAINGTMSTGNEKDGASVKAEAEIVESINLTPAQIQHRFDTLRDLSDEQMLALNKRVLKKIDWRLMPCITIMFLMR